VSDPAIRRIQEQFGPSAAAYVTSAGHASGDDLSTLVEWGRRRRPRLVLDVATGGGHTALAFAAVAQRVVACDLTEPMLGAARAFIQGRGVKNVCFVAGDVEALPFPEGTFPAVTCRIAPHHFPNIGPAVREIARVLEPGGSFFVQDIRGHDDPAAAAFILEVERRRDPSHVRAYRMVEWQALLRGAGLTIIDEAFTSKIRPWAEWTGRMRMSAEALRDLEDYVRAGSPACRDAFEFRLTDGGIESFTDRMILIRADK
jgi:ubiquinone/menaquinone biosynthesis C-methylase UbiE